MGLVFIHTSPYCKWISSNLLYILYNLAQIYTLDPFHLTIWKVELLFQLIYKYKSERVKPFLKLSKDIGL